MQVIDEETNIARLARKAGIPYLRLWRATTGTQLRPEELRSLHAAGWMLRHEGRAVPEPEPEPEPAPKRTGAELLAEIRATKRDPWATELGLDSQSEQ